MMVGLHLCNSSTFPLLGVDTWTATCETRGWSIKSNLLYCSVQLFLDQVWCLISKNFVPKVEVVWYYSRTECLAVLDNLLADSNDRMAAQIPSILSISSIVSIVSILLANKCEKKSLDANIQRKFWALWMALWAFLRVSLSEKTFLSRFSTISGQFWFWRHSNRLWNDPADTKN